MKKACFLYSALLVTLVVAADRGDLPLDLVARLPSGDKAGHFLLMGFLALLVNLALASGGGVAVVKRCALVAAVVTLEEISQVAFRHRHFEPADLAADLAGIAAFGLLAAFLLARGRRFRLSGRPQDAERTARGNQRLASSDPS